MTQNDLETGGPVSGQTSRQSRRSHNSRGSVKIGDQIMATHHGELSSLEAHLVAASGEFVGTFLWLWTSYAGHLMARHQAPGEAPEGGMLNTTLTSTALAYAFPLLANIWAFYRISGGLFNPAVRYLSNLVADDDELTEDAHRSHSDLWLQANSLGIERSFCSPRNF